MPRPLVEQYTSPTGVRATPISAQLDAILAALQRIEQKLGTSPSTVDASSVRK